MSTRFESHYVPLEGGHCPLALDHDRDRAHRHRSRSRLPHAPRPRLIDLPGQLLSPLYDLDFAFEHEEYSPNTSLYPLNLWPVDSGGSIMSPLTDAQQSALFEIEIELPLHIHTTEAHIGVLLADIDAERTRSHSRSPDTYGHRPHQLPPTSHLPDISTTLLQSPHTITTSDEPLTALHVFLFLQSFAHEPIQHRPTFVGLQRCMQARIEENFRQRLLNTTSNGGPAAPLHDPNAIWAKFVRGHLDGVNSGVVASTDFGVVRGAGVVPGSGFGGVSIIGSSTHSVNSGVGPLLFLPTPPPSTTPLHPTDRPAGKDLLLGKYQVWGFDNMAVSGHGVVHLASDTDIV